MSKYARSATKNMWPVFSIARLLELVLDFVADEFGNVSTQVTGMRKSRETIKVVAD